MRKAVMVVASSGFRDEELLQPKEILEKNRIDVKVASTVLGQVKGMLGAKITPDILISDINIRDLDAIIFVGGSGASQYWDDPLAHKLVREAVDNNKIVSAICIAPVTLVKAGVLKGRRATVWPSEAGQLKANGAIYTASAVEKDGNIITASGPKAAKQFADEIVSALLH